MQTRSADGVTAALADEEAIVEDVVVGQGRALGEAGRPGRVLDVDRVIEVQAQVTFGQVVLVTTGLGQQRRPVVRAEVDDAFQVRGLRPHRIHHVSVAGTAVVGDRDQHPAAGLAQRVLQFVSSVGRIEVDQDHPGPGGGVLQHHPFGPVRRPDPEAVADGQAGTDQGHGRLVHGSIELRVGEPDVLGQIDHRVSGGKAGGDAAQVRTDRFTQQRQRGRPAPVGLHPCVTHVLKLTRGCAPGPERAGDELTLSATR